MKEEKPNISELIEQYRFLVGGVLLGLVVASSGILLYQENRNDDDIGNKMEMLESRISELEKFKTGVLNQPKNVETTAGNEPASGEVKAASTETVAPPQPAAKTTSLPPAKSVSAPVTGKININTASAAQLDTLSGIGPAYAKAIIEYRESHGGFKSIEEIQNVKGIGPKTFEKLKDKITVN